MLPQTFRQSSNMANSSHIVLLSHTHFDLSTFARMSIAMSQRW